MCQKFYKLLIIENPQPTILHIPNRNNGIMEWWNNCISCISCQEESSGKTCGPNRLRRRRLSARRAPSHHSIFPTFHHSSCERSEPKFLNFFKKNFFFDAFFS